MSRETLGRLAAVRPARLDREPFDSSAEIQRITAHAQQVGSRRRIPARPFALAGAALGTFAVLMVAVLLGGSVLHPTPELQAPRTAHDALLAAAKASSAQSAPTAGRYFVAKEDSGSLQRLTLNGQTYDIVLRSHQEWWTAQTSEDKHYYVFQSLGAGPATQKDAQIIKSLGLTTTYRSTEGGSTRDWPTAPGEARAIEQPSIGRNIVGPTVFTKAQLANFPTDTAGVKSLLEKVYSRAYPDPGLVAQQLKLEVAFWFCTQAISPQARAAVYRVISDLPGIRSLGEVKDALGRPALAIAWDYHSDMPDKNNWATRYPPTGPGNTVQEWRQLIDPKTGAPLGMEIRAEKPAPSESWQTPGQLTSYSLTVEQGFTNDAPPQN